MLSAYNVGIQKACKIFSLSRSVYYREPKINEDDKIKAVLLQLAKKHIRWGFDKMRDAIKNHGHPWNHKRIRRIYCELGLNLRVKPKKRLPTREKKPLLQAPRPNYCWSIDFMSDALLTGQKFRTLNVLDDFNREALGILVDQNTPACRVINYLEYVAEMRGYPTIIRVDNGPEFIAKIFLQWAKKHQIEIRHIQPGKPAQNAFIERFNRTYREEVLDAYWFGSIGEVQAISDKWLYEYNYERPHEALKKMTPIDFLRSFKNGLAGNNMNAVAGSQ